MMYGFGYVWTNQVMQSVNWFLHVFKKRITDCWKQGLDDRIHKRDRYSVYSIFTLEHCVVTTTLTDVFIKFIYSVEPSDEPIYLALCVSVVLMTKSTFCVQNHRSFNTPCIRVLKFSAGASRYSEVQPEQAEAKRRTR